MQRTWTFYLIPIALGALAYPVGVLTFRWLADHVLPGVEGPYPWWYVVAVIVAVIVPPIVVVIGGTVIAAKLAGRRDLVWLVATSIVSMIVWTLVLRHLFETVPTRRANERTSADAEYRYYAEKELERNTRIGPLAHEVDGRRLELELPIITTRTRKARVYIRFSYWYAPHWYTPLNEHIEDVVLLPGQTTVVRASCEQDWTHVEPDKGGTRVSATLYQEVHRENRDLGTVSIHTDLEVPGLVGPRRHD